MEFECQDFGGTTAKQHRDLVFQLLVAHEAGPRWLLRMAKTCNAARIDRDLALGLCRAWPETRAHALSRDNKPDAGDVTV